MKKYLLPLAAALSFVAITANANTVKLSNAPDSVGPLSVTYVVAHKTQHNIHGMEFHQRLLPGQLINVNVPGGQHEQSGIIVTRIAFKTPAGKQVVQKFDVSTFGMPQSCSYASGASHQAGHVSLRLGQHKLTCQNGSA